MSDSENGPKKNRSVHAYLLALSSGVIGVLAFPGWEVWPLAFIMYIPLLISLSSASCWRAGFFRGWVTGTVLHFGSYYWVFHTMISMSDLPPPLAVLALILFGLYSGLQQALFGGFFYVLKGRVGRHWPWAITLAFVALEWIFPHIFPWYLGGSFYDQPLLVQTADIAGIHGVSFWIFLTNILLLQLVLGEREGGSRKRSAIVVVGLAILVLSYGGLRIAQIESIPVEKSLRLGMVQANVTPQDKKRKGKARGIIYEKGQKQTAALDGEELDAIVWPEGGYPYYFPVGLLSEEAAKTEKQGGGYAGKLQKAIQKRNVDFILGTLTKPEKAGKIRNSLIHLGPDGYYRGWYNKRILVPFGEYIPLSDTFPALKGNVKGIGDMAPGTERVVFDVKGVKVLPSICYEAIYPTATREAVVEEPRAEMMLNITNDMWFGDTSAPNMHLMVQTSRAVELRIPLLRSTNSGISAFVDAVGRVSHRTPVFEPTVRTVNVSIRPIYSFYAEFGNVFLYGGLLALFFLLIRAPRRKQEAVQESAVDQEISVAE